MLNPSFNQFKDKNIWIIGASSGIGEACAKLFHAKGANLVISARRTDKLEKLKELLNTSKTQASTVHIVPIDVVDQSSVTQASKLLFNHWQQIDLLLFVSGIYEPMRAEDFDFDKAYKTMNTNLLGPMRVLSETVPHFLKQGAGHIALVGSVASYSGLPNSLSYGPTKAALLNLAESLYYDLSLKGIGVHIISPGFVETPATAVNTFQMPALISPEEAATQIAKGLEKGEFEIHFPKRFSYFLKFLRILPYTAYFYILKHFVKI
jgi:short-subunit dehydrogenase